MFKKLKELFKMDHVEWVKNTNKNYPRLEAPYYLLVKNKNEAPMLFTESQVRDAKIRATKQPEDV